MISLERLGALAERRDGDAGEDGEHHDLQDLVGGHGLDDGPGHQVGDEFLERQAGGFEIGRSVGVRYRQPEIDARLQDVHHHHAKQQRHQRRADKPSHGLGADPPKRSARTHMGDADDQRRQHKRGDDHLDQPQKQVGHERNIARDCRRRVRIRKGLVAEIADCDPEDHGDQNDGGETLWHHCVPAARIF